MQVAAKFGKIKTPEDAKSLAELLGGFDAKGRENPIRIAMDKLKTVHFARFVFLSNYTELAIITSYDGSFDDWQDISPYAAEVLERFGPPDGYKGDGTGAIQRCRASAGKLLRFPRRCQPKVLFQHNPLN